MSPAYSFSLHDFESLIPEGIKVRTTRLLKDGKRYDQALKAMAEKRPVRLYWKQRTKECRLLLEAPIVEVEIVKMYPCADDEKHPTIDEVKYHMMLERNGRMTTYAQRNRYAQEEGFNDDDQLSPWENFLEGLFRLHGMDFWKERLYTVKWITEIERHGYETCNCVGCM